MSIKEESLSRSLEELRFIINCRDREVQSVLCIVEEMQGLLSQALYDYNDGIQHTSEWVLRVKELLK